MNHKQNTIIEIGKKKGYVSLNDISKYYPNRETRIDRMGGLVARGLFTQEMDPITYEAMWRYTYIGNKVNELRTETQKLKDNLIKPKVLITGSTGYLGTNLMQQINKTEQEFEAIPFKGNILKKDDLINACKGINIVVHIAGLISERRNYSKQYDINVRGTENIVEACKNNNIKRLIFISTMATKGRFKDNYSKTKALAENVVRNSKLNYTIIRSGLIYSGIKQHKIIDVIKHLTPQSFLNKPYKTNINLITNAIINNINNKNLNEVNVYDKASI